jgi:mycothiol synthase
MDVRVEEWHSATGAMPDGLASLVAEARAADGHKPIDEHALAELKAGGREMPHAAFVARIGDELVGYAHVSYRDTGNGWRFEFVTRPSHRGQGIASNLVRHVFDHVAWDGGGTLHAWQPDHPSQARSRLIEHFGMRPTRRLHQMHALLPIDRTPMPAGVTVRAFTAEDEDTWLALHNEVFAEHPDASGWRTIDLAWRMREPWFDPNGFRLAFDEHGLAGYNWVKLHEHEGASHDESDPETKVVGEIYMLGIAPRARRTGLSRAISTEGLAWAHEHGATRAMLYVDESNRTAHALYEGLGFTTTHVDVCFEVDVAGRASGGPRGTIV